MTHHRVVWMQLRSFVVGSPLPAEPSLPAFEKLSLRAKQLDRTFARPRPKLRAFRRALSPDEQLVVKRALATDGEVSSLPGAFVEGKDVQRLLPGRWLNDEITTFYGVLINRRADEADKKGELEARGLLRVHCFSSFFMNTYGPKGHAGVKKWTKKVRNPGKCVPLIIGPDGQIFRAATDRPLCQGHGHLPAEPEQRPLGLRRGQPSSEAVRVL